MAPDTTDDWRTPSTDALFDALMSLESRDEVQRFFRDLCTRHELEELTARWTVVQLLDEGFSYRRIAEATGVSTTTITRINEWLNHGTGGYRTALERSRGTQT
ncbi:MAG: YerC/YecD family TrpR-related protein [Acidimicrobiia bacterium]|jgi:TrpR-related protein YerC/YecD